MTPSIHTRIRQAIVGSLLALVPLRGLAQTPETDPPTATSDDASVDDASDDDSDETSGDDASDDSDSGNDDSDETSGDASDDSDSGNDDSDGETSGDDDSDGETSGDDDSDGETSGDDASDDAADPLAPLDAVLTRLETGGVQVSARRRTQSALQGEFLTAEIQGGDPAFILYALREIAEDGFQMLLAPEGRARFSLVALRARPGQARGVDFVSVDEVDIVGRFRRGEDASTLQTYAGLPVGGVVSTEIADRLASIGYRATFRARAAGEIEISVEPGRAIRRIRLRRHLPLPERELVRVLSPRSRPGMLAMAPCAAPKTVRTRTVESSRRDVVPNDTAPNDTAPNEESSATRDEGLCPPDDLACQEWEREEVGRLERYLYDQGYLEGRARVGVSCGKQSDQADLWIILDKGRSFRIGKIAVTGNVGSSDHRWIRRIFRPTVGPFLPIPKRVTRAHIEDAKDRVEREYAEPRGGARNVARSSLKLPYPGVRVDTNYERFTPASLPRRSRKIPLTVDVQLGGGVETQFENNDRVAESRLRPQLQLFQRREPATAATADREAENLREFYQTKGFLLADIEGRYDARGLLTRLEFSIDEGPKVRIREIDFNEPETVLAPVRSAIHRDVLRGRKLAPGGAFSDTQARTDLAALLKAYAERGYLCATASLRIAFWPEGLDVPGEYALFDLRTTVDHSGDPTWIEQQLSAAGLFALRGRRRAGLYVRFDVDPGPRVLTSSRETARHLEIPIPPNREVETLPVTSRGHWTVERMLRGGPLRREDDARAGGIPLDLGLERRAERAMERSYREAGYPLVDSEIHWLYRDPAGTVHRASQTERLTDPDMGLCQTRAEAVTVDPEVSVYEGRRATFGKTLLRGNFKTRSWLLEREIAWEEGQDYDRRRIEITRRRIEGTGTVESVQVREQPIHCDLTNDPDQPCVVHAIISVTEAKDRSMDLEWGFGFATLDPFYVFLRPSFPNMLGTGWDLRIDTHFGTNVKLPSFFCTANEDCYERTGRLSLLRQRIFASALSFEVSGQVQRRATPARGIIDSAIGEVRLTLPIRDEWRFFWAYFIQGANISKDVVKPLGGGPGQCPEGGCRITNRSEAIVPDLTGAIHTGVSWQRVDNAFNPDDGFMADADVLLASPYLGGLDWWVRLQGSWQHFIPIPGREQRFSFRYALRYGHAIPLRGWPGANTTSVPEVWRFFGGGTADLGLRGIEPQTMLTDLETLSTGFGTTIVRPYAQGGQIRALATFALQVITVRNILGGRLAHSLFIDLGVLTQRWRDVVPLRDIRRSIGINFIKWDINIVTVSLGYAVLIPNAIIPGNVRPTDDRNGRIVFDVGATF